VRGPLLHPKLAPGTKRARARMRLSTAALLACFLLLSFFRNVIFPTEQVTHWQQSTELPIQPPPQPDAQLPPSLPPPLPPAQNGADRLVPFNVPRSAQNQPALERAHVSPRVRGRKATGLSARSDMNWTLAAGLEAIVTPDSLAGERRQRESLGSSAPPQLSMAGSPQTSERSCSKPDKEACLRSAVEAVQVWDYQKGAFMLPTQAHMPPADKDAYLSPWDSAGTVWSCVGTKCGLRSRTTPAAEETPGSVILQRIWDAWESTERAATQCNGTASNASTESVGAVSTQREARNGRDSEAAASRRAVARLLAEGRQVAQREALELNHAVLAATTRSHANRPCWRHCRAEGACEWCGTSLCCKASESAVGVCHGQGGREAYTCTAVRTAPAYAERRAEALARRQAEKAEEALATRAG